MSTQKQTKKTLNQRIDDLRDQGKFLGVRRDNQGKLTTGDVAITGAEARWKGSAKKPAEPRYVFLAEYGMSGLPEDLVEYMTKNFSDITADQVYAIIRDGGITSSNYNTTMANEFNQLKDIYTSKQEIAKATAVKKPAAEKKSLADLLASFGEVSEGAAATKAAPEGAKPRATRGGDLYERWTKLAAGKQLDASKAQRNAAGAVIDIKSQDVPKDPARSKKTGVPSVANVVSDNQAGFTLAMQELARLAPANEQGRFLDAINQWSPQQKAAKAAAPARGTISLASVRSPIGTSRPATRLSPRPTAGTAMTPSRRSQSPSQQTTRSSPPRAASTRSSPPRAAPTTRLAPATATSTAAPATRRGFPRVTRQ